LTAFYPLVDIRVMKKAVAYLEPFFEEEKRKAQASAFSFFYY
jgi:cobalamin-dependent methionine synthase I